MCPGNGKFHDGREWDYYTCKHNEEGCSEIIFNECPCSYSYEINEYETAELLYDAYIVKYVSDILFVCKYCQEQYKNFAVFRKIIHSAYGNCYKLPKLTSNDTIEL